MLFGENIFQDLDKIEQLPVTKTLMRLYASNHLPHAILLFSENQLIADAIVGILANKILKCSSYEKHLDFFYISPSDTNVQITADMIRELIVKIQSSPRIAKSKVAYISHADTMNKYAANSFLKTLEEPPLDTIIFLSTTNKYNLLPTILSRCITFKISGKYVVSSNILDKFSNMCESWLDMLYTRVCINLAILEMYRLLSYIESNFDELSKEVALNKLETTAMLLQAIEVSIAKFFKKHPEIVLKLHKIISIFENSKYFLSINCNIVAYLERCFTLVVHCFEKICKEVG